MSTVSSLAIGPITNLEAEVAFRSRRTDLHVDLGINGAVQIVDDVAFLERHNLMRRSLINCVSTNCSHALFFGLCRFFLYSPRLKDFCFLERDAIFRAWMRGIVALLLAKCNLKQICPMARSWGIVATVTPKKQENNDSAETARVPNEKTEPIVAFRTPPPLPPVLGPLLAASSYDLGSSHDGDDD